jgi:general nucleoside transport system permease protein
VRMIGEAEDAALAAGVPVERIKFETMVISGLFCGLAGAYLSLGYVSLFARQMNDERGLIALAAIFFAKGRPVATTAVALMFGVATALAFRLPEMTGAAPQLLQMIPYVVTVLALVIVGWRAKRAGGQVGWQYQT